MAEHEQDDIPTVRGVPWQHKGRGVITDARGIVLGAFENAWIAEAVVRMVNALADDGK